MQHVFASVALLTLVASSAYAQAPARGWIDVDVIRGQSMQSADSFTLSTPLSGEIASASTAYPELGDAVGGNVAAGFTARGPLGIGIRLMRASYEQVIGLSVRVPHPTIFNRFGSDTDITESPMDRSETSLDLSAVYTAPTPDAWRVRIFGGPTYFRYSEDMVEIIRYSQLFNVFTGANLVDITTFSSREVEGSAWGFHGGIDAAYFFSRYVGVGGGVRLNRGTVTIDEPLTTDEAERSVGHTTFGGGLRLRF
jgi:hypothetical protein